MDTVHTTLFNAVSTYFLAEAGRIAGQGAGQGVFLQNGINEFANHGVFAGADQVQIFTLDLVHHVLHFGEGHDARHHVTVDHEGRHAIGEATINHEITSIAQNSRMQPGNIPHQVIEAIAAGLAGAVQINTIQPLHDVHMVRHLEIRHLGLAEALQLHILAVVLADGHTVINDVGDHQHPLADFRLQFFFLLLQGCQFIRHGGDLCLYLLGFFLLSLGHQAANLLGQGLALVPQAVSLLASFPVFLIEGNHLIHHGQFGILKLFADVLFDLLRVITEQIDIQHVRHPPLDNERAPPPFSRDEKLALPPRLPILANQPLSALSGAHPADSSPAPIRRRNLSHQLLPCTCRQLSSSLCQTFLRPSGL